MNPARIKGTWQYQDAQRAKATHCFVRAAEASLGESLQAKATALVWGMLGLLRLSEACSEETFDLAANLVQTAIAIRKANPEMP